MVLYKILNLYTLTPLHVGAGKDVGIVDLPIQRERISNHPICYASSLKGAMRQHYQDNTETSGEVTTIFGPDPSGGEKHAGCVVFTDARLLAFPLRSMKSTFVWVTCPLVLDRFARDLKMMEVTFDLPDDIKNFDDEDKALVTDRGEGKDPLLVDGKLVVEEYVLEGEVKQNLNQLAEFLAGYLPDSVGSHLQGKFQKDLVLLSNSLFSEFVSFCTEVVARVCLNEEKTVKAGPWYEENLPAESFLYSLIAVKDPLGGDSDLKTAENVLSEALTSAKYPYLQMGGNETIGRGLLALSFSSQETQSP